MRIRNNTDCYHLPYEIARSTTIIRTYVIVFPRSSYNTHTGRWPIICIHAAAALQSIFLITISIIQIGRWYKTTVKFFHDTYMQYTEINYIFRNNLYTYRTHLHRWNYKSVWMYISMERTIIFGYYVYEYTSSVSRCNV